MKKLLVAGLLAFGCFATSAEEVITNKVWAAPIAVTQTATDVILRSLVMNVFPNGKFLLTVNWAWVDKDGKVMRNGSTRYTEDQINAKLSAKGASMDVLRVLFLSIAAEEAQK